jgi:hypothetical protein
VQIHSLPNSKKLLKLCVSNESSCCIPLETSCDNP